MNNNQRPNNTNNPGPEGPILALLFAATCLGAVTWAGAELAALIRYRHTFPASFEMGAAPLEGHRFGCEVGELIGSWGGPRVGIHHFLGRTWFPCL